jgi:hypothetical protein
MSWLLNTVRIFSKVSVAVTPFKKTLAYCGKKRLTKIFRQASKWRSPKPSSLPRRMMFLTDGWKSTMVVAGRKMSTSLTSLRSTIGFGYRRGALLVEPSLGSIPKLAPVSFVTWVGGSLFGGLLELFRPRDSAVTSP